MKKSILVIGSGGREHALVWKLKQSPKVGKIYVAPGNAGTGLIAQNLPINIADHQQIIDFAQKNKIDLVVIGPENPLSEGIVNDLQKSGLKVFGPTREAAEIESSKAFSKKLMKEEGIPTANFEEFSDYNRALKYLKKQAFPLVIKGDGLAFGKAVTIAQDYDEAKKTIADFMLKKIHGTAGKKVIIEEYLQGFEISIHALTDGKTSVIFPSSKDHKAIFDGNRGPNTGGMGTIAPVPGITKKLMSQIEKTIIRPVLKGLEKRNRKFVGLIYPGLMITKNGPKVLEFNARFGNPETEVYMQLLNTDLFDILNSCVDGKLNKQIIKWKKGAASCVIMASRGYPETSEKGKEITGIDQASKEKDVVVFHAGTRKINGKILTNGGRVIEVSSFGKNLKESLKKTYSTVKKIKFDGMQYRTDIGKYTL